MQGGHQSEPVKLMNSILFSARAFAFAVSKSVSQFSSFFPGSEATGAVSLRRQATARNPKAIQTTRRSGFIFKISRPLQNNSRCACAVCKVPLPNEPRKSSPATRVRELAIAAGWHFPRSKSIICHRFVKQMVFFVCIPAVRPWAETWRAEVYQPAAAQL